MADDFVRMAELVTQYDDLPLGTSEVSMIALGERVGVVEVASLDHRHFRTVRVKNLAVLLACGASFHLGSPKMHDLTNEQVLNLISVSGGLVKQ